MWKQIIALIFLSSVAFGQRGRPNPWESVDIDRADGDDPATGDAREVCITTCTEICENCTDPILCNPNTQRKCGTEPVDPTKPVCTPDDICVPIECECDYELIHDNQLVTCPGVCPVNCSATEIVCGQPLTVEGCRQCGICVPRGNSNAGDHLLCDGVCEEECPCVTDKHCPKPEDENGCLQKADCIPCAKDFQGNCCPITYCPKICDECEHLCQGGLDEYGCPKEDFCVQRQVADNGITLCPGTCPCCCENDHICCPGVIEYDDPEFKGCRGQDVCKPKAKDDTFVYCPDDSASHNCECHCKPCEICCPPHPGITGCKGPEICVERSTGTDGEFCPITSDCPKYCLPNEIACDTGCLPNGCKKPKVCICTFTGFDGQECKTTCPEVCDENQVFCEGKMDDNGCMGPGTCHTKVEHKWGKEFDEGVECPPLCPGSCPTQCQDHEILCPSQEDPCNGCPTEEVCREAIKGTHGRFCAGKEQPWVDGYTPENTALRKGGYLSMSHNCPMLCREEPPFHQVLCPTYEDAYGCKPEACCYERSRGVTEEYGETWCPAHSVCPKQCPKGYRLCEYEDLDDYGCKVAPRCVYKGKNKKGIFCPGNCPPICKKGETLVADGVDQNGCEICPKCQPQYE